MLLDPTEGTPSLEKLLLKAVEAVVIIIPVLDLMEDQVEVDPEVLLL